MKPPQMRVKVWVVLALLLSAAVGRAGAIALSPAPDVQSSNLLSPYWNANVQFWDAMIVKEAERRSLDPDLVAAVLWVESRGDSQAIGPGGAVGLMQVMSKEAGFSWRPTQQELLDPATNLFWGTRTLATVIHQGHGDLFYALAAYNGGWELAANRRPRAYATAVMRDYAAAIAHRHGVTERWVAFFAVQAPVIQGPIWVADVVRSDVYFYGQENLTLDGSPLIPARSPTTFVARCVDETTGEVYTVGMWLYVVAQGLWLDGNPTPGTVVPLPTASPTSSPTPLLLQPTSTPEATLTSTPTPSPTPLLEPSVAPTWPPLPTASGESSPLATPEPPLDTLTTDSATPTVMPTAAPLAARVASPTPTASPTAETGPGAVVGEAGAELRPGPTLWWDPTETLPAATRLRVLGYAENVPDWVCVETLDGRLVGWTQKAGLKISRDLQNVPEVTPRPTLTASPTPSPTPTPTVTPTPKPEIACNGLPLFGEAWQMQKFNTLEGWTAVVFARGHEGTCRYTYAWDDPANVVGGPTSESVMFEVSSPHRAGNIAGSVIISDGENTVVVGIFIRPPDSGE